MNSVIVNHLYFWQVLKTEADTVWCSAEQRLAISHLEHLTGKLELNHWTFVELSVSMVTDILSILVHEMDEGFNRVVNGRWFRIAIEPDGYMVLTGDNVLQPICSRLPGV